MITTFLGTPQYEVYNKARDMVGFKQIKESVLSIVNSNPETPNDMRLAIALAAEKLDEYPSTSHNDNDGALLGILFMDWGTVGVDGVDDLTEQQRIGILNVVLSVCKSIINDKAASLTTLADQDMRLPENWNTPDTETEV